MPPESPAPPARPRLRRLPGRSPSVRLSRTEASARLWIDDGQLVQETVRSSTQEIQRFAFADIQAVQIRRTVRGLVYNVVLSIMLALPLIGLAGVLAARNPSVGDRVALAVGSGIFALLLVLNIVRGPTCRTVLLTALGPQHLPSLSRMRAARRALDAIITHTEAVQGALPPEEVAQQVDRAQQAQRPVAPPPPAQGPPVPKPPAPLPGYHY